MAHNRSNLIANDALILSGGRNTCMASGREEDNAHIIVPVVGSKNAEGHYTVGIALMIFAYNSPTAGSDDKGKSSKHVGKLAVLGSAANMICPNTNNYHKGLTATAYMQAVNQKPVPGFNCAQILMSALLNQMKVFSLAYDEWVAIVDDICHQMIEFNELFPNNKATKEMKKAIVDLGKEFKEHVEADEWVPLSDTATKPLKDVAGNRLSLRTERGGDKKKAVKKTGTKRGRPAAANKPAKKTKAAAKAAAKAADGTDAGDDKQSEDDGI
jgi:hypothetical protein